MNTALKTILLVSAISLGFAATGSAQPAFHHAGFGWSSHHGSSFGFSASWGGHRGGHGGWSHHARPYPVYAPVYAPVYVAPMVHTHVFTISTRRVWVDPVYSQQFVGYDCYGQPIYQSVCVRQGYWRDVRYSHCGCGHTVDCGY
ncbi:MAG: hypothetical protein V2A76_05175 [Planctomycetota bacterium]